MTLNWHDCDGRIGAYLRLCQLPSPEWNKGVGSWAITTKLSCGGLELLPIRFCPVCGEELRGPNA